MNLRQWWPVPAAILTVILDGFLKQQALLLFPGGETMGRFLAVGLHKNPGIAFDVPFKPSLIFALSAVIALFLIKVLIENRQRHPEISVMSALILIGAAGNLYDRIVYGFTVDYFFILNRLAINLSDLVILIGVGGLLLSSRRTRLHERTHPDEPKRM